MKVIQGIPVSSGVVIGTVYVLSDARRHVRRRTVPEGQVGEQLERFERARQDAIADINEMHRAAEAEMGAEAAKIFLFHVGALSDPNLAGKIRSKIESERVTAEYAVHSVFRDWIDLFSAKPDPTFQSKVSDLIDIRRRLLDHLMGARENELADMNPGTVVIARDLTPSQTAAFDRDKVIAFVTDLGGKTSHTAILARALAIPAVVGAQIATETARDGQRIIIDAERGLAILDPDEQTLERARRDSERAASVQVSLQRLSDQPAVTADGVHIQLLGNIEFPEEIDAVLSFGGDGIGLYRTEFLYLTSPDIPSEKTHFKAYTDCLKKLDGKPLIIRTVDLGADKYTQERTRIPERNPFLGLRSIRYCLQNLGMFKTQLRAILRASAHGQVRIMFPLITSIAEFRKAKMLVHDAMEDLDDQGVAYDREIPIGMMVEVPSAAVLAPAFAREADFFSIGTNDLVQYTLAVDRTNERVASLYNPAHPAVTKLIRDTARAGRRAQIPVSCCGEAAGEPEFAALLLGLGVRTLSVTATDIPPIKRLIRNLSIPQCERLAKKAISLDSEAEASAYLRDRTRKLVPEAFDGRSVDPQG